ncbi:hypothetical protein BC826DRAFT_900809, partial [Russula brevipes]
RRLLILGYLSGLQIWDCTNLDSITEMLNVSSPEWGHVLHAEVLPSPVATGDEFLSSRPVLGVISKRLHHGPEFLVYSLSTHKVPHSSSRSTTTTNSDTTTVLPSTVTDTDSVSALPHPVFALSNRFLAYACRTPTTVAPGQSQTKTPVLAEGVSSVQADLGGMALRVGGSVLSGMRALGGRAFTAARARISDSPAVSEPKPLSSSAPEQETLPKESDSQPSRAGCHVTILDLAPLADPSPRAPELIVEFLASKRQSISALQFSADGGAIMVVPSDGQTIKVFQVRPIPRALRFVISKAEQPVEGHNAPAELVLTRPKESAPWHVYDLRRGRTSAVVENLDWATDGRWIALATQKRTVHIFATNPYGGQPDSQSHVKGRVCNSSKLSLSTSLSPLVRLRCSQPLASRPPAPLAFIFVHSNAHSLPKRLLPPIPLSPLHRHRRTDFQDILIFDPADGSLSLRRCVIGLHPAEQTLSVPNSVPGIGGTSISLPSRPSLG